MKKIIIVSLLIIGLAAGISYAHGNGWGGHMMGSGYGGHMMGSGYGGHMMGSGYGGHMRGSGYDGHMMGYNDGYNDCPGAAYFGENGWNSEGHQKFLDDTVSLRKELNDKRFDYLEAERNPNTSQDTLASLENAITGLEKQLQDRARQY